MEFIGSKQNSRVKEWKKLSTKKGRQENKSYLLEGRHLIEEAMESQAKFHAIIGTEDEIEKIVDIAPDGVPLFVINDIISEYITETKNTQGVFAEISLPQKKIDPSYIHNGRWLLLDNIQDPGNVGTLIRTADAAGWDGVIVSSETADVYSPKVVRSMQGSQFHIEVATGDLIDWIDKLQSNSINVYGTNLSDDSIDYHKVDLEINLGLVLGNEGKGVSSDISEKVSQNITIPIYGKAESLNVAVAGGILMYGLHH